MAESSPLATVRIRALWARAVINNYEGRHADASKILNHAIVLAQSHGLVALEIETLRELAISELLGGRYRETINATGYLLQLSEIHRDFYSTQRALDLQATASCMLGVDTQDSLNHLQTSLIRAKEREVPKDILRCHQNLAKALEALGRHDEAEFHKAQTLSSRGPGQSVVAQSLHGI
jgi:tetratricopeptide (TPR) repeat protein